MLLLYAVATKNTLVNVFLKKIVVFHWLFLYEHTSNTFDCIFGLENYWKITKFLCGFNRSFFMAVSTRAAN